jgi:hypothetical protein
VSRRGNAKLAKALMRERYGPLRALEAERFVKPSDLVQAPVDTPADDHAMKRRRRDLREAS